MLIIPKEIQEMMLADAVKYNIRLSFPNKERTDITCNQIVEGSAKFTESLCSQDSLKFGLCESPTFECETVGVGNINGKEIDIVYEVLCDSNITGAEFRTDIQKFVFPIPMGRFVVTSCERQADMQHRKIVAYGGMGAVGVNMPDIEVFKQSLILDVNAPYKVDLTKLALSLCDDVPTDEPMTLSESEGYFYINQAKQFEFVFQYYVVRDANTIDNVLKVEQNLLMSYDDIIGKCKDMALKFCEEEGITLTEAERIILDNLFIPNYYGIGQRITDKYVILKPRARYIGINTQGQREVFSCPINSNLIYPFMNYGSSSMNGEIHIPYGVYLRYGTKRSGGFDFRDNINVYEMSLDIPKYEATATRKSFSTPWGTQYPIDDASAITKADYQKVLEASLELIGKIGRINRNNGFDVINLDKHFYLLPNDDLMPDAQLKPLGVGGGSIGKSQYSSLWYEEEYTKPYGRVYCEYTNNNGTQSVRNVYLNGFNSNSDTEDFLMYSLTSNEIIHNNQYTQSEITEIMEVVADALKDVSYVPLKLQCVSIPFVESGDTLEVLTQNNDSITTIVMKRTLSGESYVTDEITSV